MIKRKIKIIGTDIYIADGLFNSAIEKEHVFEFQQTQPILRVFENKELKRTFIIEPLKGNPDLRGFYLHGSIRILNNDAVMIDGIISMNANEHPDWKSENYESIRFQPFFLSSNELENQKLAGKGLFDRGLHFSGTVTPSGVRTICICDECEKSFTLQHFHAGFSESQYFYSSDGKQTLAVNYSQIPNMPTQLQEDLNEQTVEEVDSQLPKPTLGSGTYNYFNFFKCPHCMSDFIDFRNNPNSRSKEYYGYSLINRETQKIE